MAILKSLFFVTLWLHTSTALDASDQSVDGLLSHIIEELGELRKQNAAMEVKINQLKERDAHHSGRIAVLEARERELTEEIDELRRQGYNAGNQDSADQTAAVDAKVNEAGPDFDGGNGAEGMHWQETNVAKGTEKNQNRIRQIQQEMPVAFFATLTSHATHLGVNQPIAFDNVITNDGSAYHSSTGAFVAPVSGVYVFSATILSHYESANFKFVVNGQFRARMYADVSDAYETTCQTAIFNLKQGDDVFIQNEAADKMVHGNHYSSLSGFLLYLNSNDMTSQAIG